MEAQATQISTALETAWPQVTDQNSASAESLVAMESGTLPQTLDICKAMDPNIAQGSGPCPDVSMTPSGSSGHPDQNDYRLGTVSHQTLTWS